MDTRYIVTLWKLEGKEDTPAQKCEFGCATEWELIELFDLVTRAVRGHYKAWAVDMVEGREVRYSEVSYSQA